VWPSGLRDLDVGPIGQPARSLKQPCHVAHGLRPCSHPQRLCQAVRANRSLRTLELPDNRITDAGAADLAALLRGNMRLTTLSLACNRIGNEGAMKLAEVGVCGGSRVLGGSVRC
jgi:hypothetical protein